MLPSAEYWLDMDGDGGEPAALKYCEMTTDGGGWMRCRLVTTEQQVPVNFLSACRGFGASAAMFKLYENSSGRSESNIDPIDILTISGVIDNAFEMTERNDTWRVHASRDWNLRKVGGTSATVRAPQVWFDCNHSGDKAEMCLGGTNGWSHYRCIYSGVGRGGGGRLQLRENQWHDNRSTEIFVR